MIALIRPSFRIPDLFPRRTWRVYHGYPGNRRVRLADGRIRTLTVSLAFDNEYMFLWRHRGIDCNVDCAVSLLLHGDPLPKRFDERAMNDGPEGLMCCTVGPDVLLVYRNYPDRLHLEALQWTNDPHLLHRGPIQSRMDRQDDDAASPPAI